MADEKQKRRDKAQKTDQSKAPPLCSTGCGVLGSPRNNGMCSACYRDSRQRRNSNRHVSPPGPCTAVSAAAVGGELEAPCSAGSSGTAAPSQRTDVKTRPSVKQSSRKGRKRKLDDSDEDRYTYVSDSKRAKLSVDSPAPTKERPEVNKQRCFTCRKKVGLIGFDCRCGNVFCSLHRYSDTHNCTFDYRAAGREEIRKENPVVVKDKIRKI